MGEHAIHSMTGYGRGAATGQRFRATAELRSVNGRFLEIRLKLPRALSFLEPKSRTLVEQALSRGVVDVSVLVHPVAGALETNVNLTLAKSYASLVRELAADGSIAAGLSAMELLKLPGVVGGEDPTLYEQDPELPGLVESALRDALAQLVEMRKAEGAKLGEVLRRELSEVNTRRDWIHGHREELNGKYFKKLEARLQDLLGKTSVPIDVNRLHQEVAFYVERSDVTEELDRLASHLQQCEAALAGASAKTVGKRLEFLAQEMGREVNTIGAKSDQLPVTNHVLEMKLVLEKIREQVQNLE